MSDLWSLALGVIFFVLWLAGSVLWEKLRDAKLQGRLDVISKKDRSPDYSGIYGTMYKKGRREELAVRYGKDKE